jgi:hypothetical protein
MTAQYSKLQTPEAKLEYLLLFVCGSRPPAKSAGTTLSSAAQMPVRTLPLRATQQGYAQLPNRVPAASL